MVFHLGAFKLMHTTRKNFKLALLTYFELNSKSKQIKNYLKMNNNENMIYQNLQVVAKSKHTFI